MARRNRTSGVMTPSQSRSGRWVIRTCHRSSRSSGALSPAVVAGDVRARAVQAVGDMPGRDRGRRVVGYLICSRYADVWHLMNIAVDPPMRRRGIATGLLEEMIARAGDDASYTLEVRPSNAPRSRCTSASASGRPVRAGAITRTPGGRADHVAHGRERVDPERVRVILALETSCDDTCAAVVTTTGEIRFERDLLPGGPRPLRRRRARDRLAAPPRADRRRRRRRARARRRVAPGSRHGRGHARAGTGHGSARRSGHGQGTRGGARTAARAGRPPARPRRRRVSRTDAVRAAVPQPDRERRPHAARARDRSGPGLRGDRPDARRRRRRGLRQGRAAARPRLSGWPALEGSPGTAIRTRSSSRPPNGSPAWTSRSPG